MLSYYNFGSIALDAIVYPAVFFVMMVYSMTKANTSPREEETNRCVMWLNNLTYKARKIIEM